MFALKLLKSTASRGVVVQVRPAALPGSRVRFAHQHQAADEHQSNANQTHFGYQTINESEKEEKGNVLYYLII